jgi:excisionase family DNA binding protein
MMEELLGVAAVAAYLGVHPMTVYRWGRDGRLPALKVGKSWRVARPALEEFLRRGRRPRTLVGHFGAFLTLPDHVIGVAATPDLLHRFDAAFFQVGAARGGVLVKVSTGAPSSEDALRAAFTRHGLEVARLEEAGRFRFTTEPDPRGGRAATLRRLLDPDTAGGAACGRPSTGWSTSISRSPCGSSASCTRSSTTARRRWRPGCSSG